MDDIPLAPPAQKNRGSSPSPGATKGVVHAAPRRGFFGQALAVIIGGFVSLVPVAAGLAVYLDPLRRKSKTGNLVRITTLDSLPDDGVPRQFPVLMDRQDAWNRNLNDSVGSVFLRRMPGTDKVEAFNASCPHAGCSVAFKTERNEYQCPCHTSVFKVDGERVMPCVSPRDLDSLTCDVRENGNDRSVYVEFVNFYAGLAEKLPKA